mmetsp:Transcript_44373/g.77976  ORF Transcript_44373/g.77976 Transcript_44373/m.77976 type:complete len:213 (-) Transcript_44373:516-1154(-)
MDTEHRVIRHPALCLAQVRSDESLVLVPEALGTRVLQWHLLVQHLLRFHAELALEELEELAEADGRQLRRGCAASLGGGCGLLWLLRVSPGSSWRCLLGNELLLGALGGLAQLLELLLQRILLALHLKGNFKLLTFDCCLLASDHFLQLPLKRLTPGRGLGMLLLGRIRFCSVGAAVLPPLLLHCEEQSHWTRISWVLHCRSTLLRAWLGLA